jgi:hypothetical protein
MNEQQATFELGCVKERHWGCSHRDAREYARQVNWNQRYLKSGDGDKLTILRSIRVSLPPTTSHLHNVFTPPDCPLCVPHYPLTYADGFSKGPGLYAAFKKACKRRTP